MANYIDDLKALLSTGNQITNDHQSKRELRQEIKKILGTDSGGDFSIDGFSAQAGDKVKIPDDIGFRNNPGRGENRIYTSGELDRYVSDVERAAERKADLEKTLEEYSDHTKGRGKAAKLDLEQETRELEKLGKDAQRRVYDVVDDLKNKKDTLREAVRDLTEDLRAQHIKVEDTFKNLKFDDKTGAITNAATLSNLDHHEFKVNVDGKDFVITKAGIEDAAGKKITKLTKDEFRGLKESSKSAAESYFSDAKNELKDAHAKATEVLEQKIEHANDLKKKFSEHTGIGEHTEGVKASTKSAGGKAAASKGVMSEKTYEGLGFTERLGADVKANWKSGGMGKVKVAGGALIVLDGARRIGGALIGSSEPDKQDDGKWGQVVVGAGEVLGGGLLARMGGKSHALGA